MSIKELRARSNLSVSNSQLQMNNTIYIYDCACLYTSDIIMYGRIRVFLSSINNVVSILANLGSSLTFTRAF